MHELALMENMVAAVGERVRPARVGRLRLQIGQLAGVLPETIAFCFALCARGTALDGARLEIDEVCGRGLCRRCGGDVTMETAADRCRCGSAEIEVMGGRELRVATLELQ
ncbi:MAG TPA: hydrogenase maturation nickel metallochaperone HypA [Polyangia bacterium]